MEKCIKEGWLTGGDIVVCSHFVDNTFAKGAKWHAADTFFHISDGEWKWHTVAGTQNFSMYRRGKS